MMQGKTNQQKWNVWTKKKDWNEQKAYTIIYTSIKYFEASNKFSKNVYQWCDNLLVQIILEDIIIIIIDRTNIISNMKSHQC